MGSTSDPTLFVAIHPPHHYFNCWYPLAQVVDQYMYLSDMYHFPPDLCHPHQEATGLGTLPLSPLSVPFTLLVIPLRLIPYAFME